MKRMGLTLATVLAFLATAYALEDSQQNRVLQAERYLQAAPLSDMIKSMAEQGAMNFPPDQRAEFKATLIKHLDLDALSQSMKKLMIKHFTADELSALADFYGSPIGKSAMKKFGAYMADVMPIIWAEMIKAQAKANRELKDAEE